MSAGFAIELRERYGDVVRDRRPVSINAQPDELLSSWLRRLAIANGIAPRPLAGVIGLGDGMMWSPRVDLQLPREVATLLGDQTGVPQEAISAMAMTGWASTPLLLPLRENVRRNRSTWMQYCPLCLADDQAPYFRRQWRLASRVSCFVHGCGLRDRCPACRGGIAAFDQTELIPQHFCARCGFDLRRPPKASLKATARRLERAIDDICRMEVAKGSPPINGLISRLLCAPVVADATSANTLTNLSTSARIRCFESLAAKPDDWLAAEKDATTAHRRRLILAAGGHDLLIARFTDLLEKHQDLLRPKRSSPQGTDLPALLTAYARIMTG